MFSLSIIVISLKAEYKYSQYRYQSSLFLTLVKRISRQPYHFPSTQGIIIIPRDIRLLVWLAPSLVANWRGLFRQRMQVKLLVVFLKTNREFMFIQCKKVHFEKVSFYITLNHEKMRSIKSQCWQKSERAIKKKAF